jgi:hypothetical protein
VSMLEPLQEDEKLFKGDFFDHDGLLVVGNAACRDRSKLTL